MSNERIDLNQFEGLFEPNLLVHVFEEVEKVGFKDKTGVWAAKTPPIYFDRKTVDAIEMLPELITELKRCYEELDFLKANVLNDDDELWWIATCKPDGEGQCTMEIEGYEELMRLVKEGKVEIPEYSHGFDELLLQEGCECGVTHDEWLEGKN
tara:strand:+ start:270 stop:728 length:459 start_codon:yes stop_codon:yes gene_type:complete